MSRLQTKLQYLTGFVFLAVFFRLFFRKIPIIEYSTQIQRIYKTNPLPQSAKVTDYSWIGNHWIPPSGVPTFTPSQMLEYFQQRNVLFIGDSTGRRAYATMFAMMNATDWRDVDVDSIDSKKVIDVNKGRRYGEEVCLREERQIYNSTFSEALCRDLPLKIGTEDESKSTPHDHEDGYVRNDGSSTTYIQQSYSHSQKKGKFDYLKSVCYIELHDYFTNLTEKRPTSTSLSQDYDLIVITVGMWDIVRGWDCRNLNDGTRIEDPLVRLNMALSTLQAISSPKLQIAFRTVGSKDFNGEGGNDLSWNMIKSTNDFFASMGKQTSQDKGDMSNNLTIVDWGTVISRRSGNGRRIHGDLPVHYGLEARLLFSQQLMHALILDDQARADN